MTNEEIFNDNVNIAYKIANRYRTNYYEEIEDIQQIALIELWRCVVNWEFTLSNRMIWQRQRCGIKMHFPRRKASWISALLGR